MCVCTCVHVRVCLPVSPMSLGTPVGQRPCPAHSSQRSPPLLRTRDGAHRQEVPAASLHLPREALNQVTRCDPGRRSPATSAGDPAFHPGSPPLPLVLRTQGPLCCLALRQSSLCITPSWLLEFCPCLCAQGPMSLRPGARCPLLMGSQPTPWVRTVTRLTAKDWPSPPPCVSDRRPGKLP